MVMSPGIEAFVAGLDKFLNDQPMKFCYKELHILTPAPGHRGIKKEDLILLQYTLMIMMIIYGY